MVETISARPAEPGQPLPCTFEVREPIATPIALRVLTDPEHGLVEIVLGVSALRFILAPEVALELSLHLVSRVNDLRHSRGGRP